MRYVVAGYTVVLGLLFLYALSLAWRRRRLTRAAMRVESHRSDLHLRVGADRTAGTDRPEPDRP